MPDVYPVYLELGWKHCVSSVSRVSDPETHYPATHRHHHYPTKLAPLQQAPRLPRLVRQQAHERAAAARARARPWHRQRARRLQHAGHGRGWGWPLEASPPAYHVTVLRGRQTYTCTLTSVYFVPVYLAVYLVCICFQDRNTQIHAYPHPSHPVYLTSRV